MQEPPNSLYRSERFDLHALHETSRLLSSSLDLQFVLDNLLLTAMSKLLVSRGAVLLYEPDRDDVGAKSAGERQYRVATSRGMKGMEAGGVIPVHLSEPDGPLLDEAVPSPFQQHRLRLVLRIATGQREIGLIALGGKATGQSFDPRELQFIQSLVHMSAAAVQNSVIVRELTETNRALDNKIQQLNTLFDLSQEFNATIDRNRLTKVLSFALMGQLVVHKYLFLLRKTASPGRGTAASETSFDTVTYRGMPSPEISPAVSARLCELDAMVVLEGDELDDHGLGELKALGIAIVVPLMQHGETCGVLGLGPKMTDRLYTSSDVEFLYALGNLALVSIQNTFLVEQQIEKERLEEEMRLAREIQERLLPRDIPIVPGVEVASLAMPSRHVGGDYFDVIRLDPHRLLVAVADVTGKGMPASLLMANLQACLHVLEPMDMTLEEATVQINRVICANTDSHNFITFFYGIYNTELRSLHYVNAGHNPPILLRRDGNVELLDTGGLLLGVMPDVTYERGLVSLGPHDLLVLYTDGVTEAANAHAEEFGEERLIELLTENRDAPPDKIVSIVQQRIGEFTGSPDLLQDDLTLVIVRITGASS